MSDAADLGLDAFVGTLSGLTGPDGGPYFARGHPISVARAPGRLDVMGGIADYSGSLVLELTIRQAVFAAVQLQDDPAVDVVSLGVDGMPSREASRADVSEPGTSTGSSRWADYILGAFSVLASKRGARFGSGARICIGSTVPEGRGVASSAAVEVAAMSAIVDAYELGVGARDVALLCQRLENEVVGVPCGPMDQFTVALGEESRLLALLCRPAEELPAVDFPDGVVAIGIDSGTSHSNAGIAYRRARAAAFMGKTILEQRVGPVAYLTELDPSELRRQTGLLPEVMVEHGEWYPVRAAVRHAIEEFQRAQEFAELLPRARSRGELEHLGGLMNLAHEGYSACGLGSTVTDSLAEELRDVPGVFGARVSGGGGGGTVAALIDVDALPGVAKLARDRRLTLFSGSSPGADRFGTRTVSLPA